MITRTHRRSALLALVAMSLLLAFAPGAASAALPDPLDRGPYTATEIPQYLAGTVNLQEPNAGGGAATGASAAATVQVRGSAWYPSDRATPSPVIILVHGNHGSCDSGSAPNCTAFKRNDRGYAYMASNLASWGYSVFSVDQDQLIFYQDNAMGKGMHQRRLLIAATLDALYARNQDAVADDANNNLGGTFVGKLDFARIGLMGHSRGGDAVTSFIDYNRTRPAPGRRYDLRGVISLAPVDYERKAPYGMPYMTEFGLCDGDVSNMQGARFFERSQYINMSDPFPRIQMAVQGANHNYYNSVWSADNDDQSGADVACGPAAANSSTSVRLTGGVTVNGATPPTSGANTTLLGTYTWANRGSGDPALMGEQEKIGLATENAFFRRYVGGEGAFDPYMTGELSQDGVTPGLPASACPDQATGGTRISCFDRMKTSFFSAPSQREDVIRPETDNPLTTSALGTALTASGFVNPYLESGGISPKPATTDSGLDWCNPEPTQFAPSQLGIAGLPTATKGCPLPAAAALGGQSGTRENGPINQSYGLQLAVAWDHPLDQLGAPATLSTRIPTANGDVSDMKSLTMGAGVNFWDPRNPDRGTQGLWDPEFAEQDFTISLTDKAGHVGTVSADDPKYGTALQPSLGSTTSKLHVVLNSIRVPLTEFSTQGVDLTKVRKITLSFGGEGKPQSGSIQLADVRFQESKTAPLVLADSAVAHRGPGVGPAKTGPDPAALIAQTPRTSESPALPSPIVLDGPKTAAITCIPKATLAAASVSGRTLRARGTAASPCGAKLASVQVTVFRKAGAKCRFVTGKGTLTKPLPCSSEVGLVATRTGKWSLKVQARKALPKGTYGVYVRAYDKQGGVQPAGKAVKVRA